MLVKFLLSVGAWLLLTLIAAAGLQIATGRARPGLVPLIIFPVLVPVLFRIWRRRRP